MTKRRESRTHVVVSSDLPKITGVQPWERELLLPVVERLLDDALAEDAPREQTPDASDMPRTKTKSPEIRNVVLYARVSTPEQAEKDLSIPAQFDALRRYCSAHSYTVVNEYVEPGSSAYQDDDRRPVFRRMIGDVTTAGAEVQAILVCYTSRFYRNRTNAGAMKGMLRKRRRPSHRHLPRDHRRPDGAVRRGALRAG